MMTHQVHLILNSETGTLSDILRDVKGHTSKSILKLLKTIFRKAEKNECCFILNVQVQEIPEMKSTRLGSRIINRFYGIRKKNVITDYPICTIIPLLPVL